MLLFRAGKADKALMLSAAIRMKNMRLAGDRSSGEPQVPVPASDQAAAFLIQAVRRKHENVKEIRGKESKC